MQYALPVYNLEHLSNISDDEIQFTIDDNTFLECLLLKIRGESIKFASNLKKTVNLEEENLKREIKILEGNVTDSTYNSEILDLKKQKLIDLRNKKIDGQMIRSRINWLQDGEKPSKYFSSLENKNYLEKTIQKLKIEANKIISNQKEILNEVKKFYADLFSNKDSLLRKCDLHKTLSGVPVSQLDD